MRIQRAAWISGGVLFGTLALYLLVTIGQFPSRVPMQYDGQNQPTWYSSTSGFYTWFIIPWLAVNGLLVALRRQPLVGIIFAFVNYVFLVIFHLTYTQATGNGVFQPTPNQAIVAILVPTLALVGFGIAAKLRSTGGSPRHTG